MTTKRYREYRKDINITHKKLEIDKEFNKSLFLSNIGEELRVFNSSKNFKPVIEIDLFVAKLSTKYPVHTEIFNENYSQQLEKSFIILNCRGFIPLNKKELSKILNPIKGILLVFDVVLEVFKIYLFFLNFR